ncbi:MAG: chitinase [Actinomycetota bacterium]|nr:chitinase [Actinomycetota bacterium]
MKRRHTLTAAAVAVAVTGTLLATAIDGMAAPGRARKTVLAASSTCTGPTWSKTTAYAGGSVVTHGGHTWKAKWWTYGDTPGANGPDVWADGGACAGGASTTPKGSASPTGPTASTTPSTTASPTASTTASTTKPSGTSTTATGGTAPAAGAKVIGYFTEWGVYGRNYHVKNIETSGAADKLTHIIYAFGNVTNGQCAIGDAYADYDKAYTAADSVDGVADTWDTGALRGNFGQLRKLKKKHPNLKVLWSFGGWTWSPGFSQAVKSPAAFAASCHKLVEDPRWADVFDGIDIDWEYPNACGVACDTSGRSGYKDLMAAMRSTFGTDGLVTSAITGDGSSGGKLDAADYAGAAASVDWYMAMTYDYAGAFNPTGPTAPHSPLTSYSGQPSGTGDSAAAVAKLKALGVPSSKVLLGIGFYGRGWTGVSGDAAGGKATGAAPGTYEAGIEDYKVLKTRCPATGTIGGTAYARCGDQWWSYDTPQTITGKMNYAKQQKLGGAFFWELSGDTTGGELITAVSSGLR